MIRPEFQRMASRHSVPSLLRLYRRAIDGLDSGLYTRAQRQSWLQWADSTEDAGALLRRGITVLAVYDGKLAGFAQLYPQQRVNMLYVDPEWSRRGIGSHLVRVMEQVARHRGAHQLRTRASHASRPLFTRAGFVAEEIERVNAPSGVPLEGVAMNKGLAIHAQPRFSPHDRAC